MKTIRFKTPQNFEGRNGFFTASGIEIYYCDYPDDVHLSLFPITSKNKTGRCMIQIDGESIETFIKIVAKECGIDLLCGEDIAELWKQINK